MSDLKRLVQRLNEACKEWSVDEEVLDMVPISIIRMIVSPFEEVIELEEIHEIPGQLRLDLEEYNE